VTGVKLSKNFVGSTWSFLPAFHSLSFLLELESHHHKSCVVIDYEWMVSMNGLAYSYDDWPIKEVCLFHWNDLLFRLL
jgi:hypothetical protein